WSAHPLCLGLQHADGHHPAAHRCADRAVEPHGHPVGPRRFGRVWRVGLPACGEAARGFCPAGLAPTDSQRDTALGPRSFVRRGSYAGVLLRPSTPDFQGGAAAVSRTPNRNQATDQPTETQSTGAGGTSAGSDLAVVILAAGAGTRMKSATPKTLHAIGGRTLLAHSLHAAAGAQPSNMVAVIGHGRDQVGPACEQVAQDLGREIHLAVQEEQNGTGHAVQCAMNELVGFHGTVIVTNADVPLLTGETLTALYRSHTEVPTAVTVLSVEQSNPTGYGRIVRSEYGDVMQIVEEKDATEEQRAITEVNSGVFAFDAEILRDALSRLNTTNAQGELYLTDVLSIARADGHPVRAHTANDPAELAGVNDRVQLARAGEELNRRVLERTMRGGATIVDPHSTRIDVDVQVGQDVTILPGTQLLGHTQIADDATVGPDTTLHDTTVGEGASVVRTHALSSCIGAGDTGGPSTSLRPGWELGDEGKLGGFVDTKNATICRRSKVPLLTYLGDATIDEYSIIGASSVFASYDWVNKHHTTIGSHV